MTLVLGLLCLNYTKAPGVERHRKFAETNGLPRPGITVFYTGVTLTTLGAGSLGFNMGRRRG